MKWSTKITARRLFPHDPKDVQVVEFVTWTTLWSWELTSVLFSSCWIPIQIGIPTDCQERKEKKSVGSWQSVGTIIRIIVRGKLRVLRFYYWTRSLPPIFHWKNGSKLWYSFIWSPSVIRVFDWRTPHCVSDHWWLHIKLYQRIGLKERIISGRYLSSGA